MRRNPYKISEKRGLSPRLKDRLRQLPTLKGHEGRWLRWGLIAFAVLLIALIAVKFLKPETQLMNSVEIRRIEEKGILTVGVREDIPGFCDNGEGLEAELARLFAQRILPDSEEPVKLVPCTSTTVTTKLQDDSIDVAIALRPTGSSSGCSFSYPYFTDKVYLVTLSAENAAKLPKDLKIGYIPETPAGSAFTSYVKKLTAAPEQSIISKLLRKPKPTAEPGSAITIDSTRCGSYDELISALVSGRIEAAVMAGAYVNKYFCVEREELELPTHYLCGTVIGTVDYCIISSSEDQAFTLLSNMLIYELKNNGELEGMVEKWLPQMPR